MQRAEVGATEGIAWELLWKLVTIKQAQNEPQSLTDMLNHALPSFLKGIDRQGRGLESTQHDAQAEEGALQPPGMHRLCDILVCCTTAIQARIMLRVPATIIAMLVLAGHTQASVCPKLSCQSR